MNDLLVVRWMQTESPSGTQSACIKTRRNDVEGILHGWCWCVSLCTNKIPQPNRWDANFIASVSVFLIQFSKLKTNKGYFWFPIAKHMKNLFRFLLNFGLTLFIIIRNILGPVLTTIGPSFPTPDAFFSLIFTFDFFYQFIIFCSY